MRVRFLALIVCFGLAAACSRPPESIAQPPDSAYSVDVVEISGPLSFRASHQEQDIEIRLAMLETPEAARTQEALITTLTEDTVMIAPVSDEADRYGRIIARAWLGTQAADSLQAQLVSEGLARVLAYPDSLPGEIAHLLALEDEARLQGRGIWADPAYRVRDTDPDLLIQDVGRLQLVEGRVMDVAILRSGRAYLNFGSDWRTDFTIRIDEGDVASFERTGIELPALEGQRVRVRGVIRSENGPMIRLTSPMRLEVLDRPDAGR